MTPFPPTLILRHRKENLKKCSLRGLEQRQDLQFFSYPWKVPQPSLENTLVLTMEGPPLKKEDHEKGLFLIDGTWRHAALMLRSLKGPYEQRSLPPIQTAYPRKQEDCPDPTRGLATVEALYIAYTILGRDTSGLLDHYHWKEEFLCMI